MPHPIYKLESEGRLLTTGPCRTRLVTLGAVAKENNLEGAAYCIPNELICGELARFLRLPAPPIAVVANSNGVPMVASLDFNRSGEPLTGVNFAEFVNSFPFLATGILLFDAWVANGDRHASNLYIDFSGAAPTVHIFDHSHALLAQVPQKGERRLAAVQHRLAMSGCLLDALNTDIYFTVWLDRIKATPDWLIEEICQDAAPYGLTPSEVQAVIGFLKRRRDGLRHLIFENRGAFKAIAAWTSAEMKLPSRDSDR